MILQACFSWNEKLHPKTVMSAVVLNCSPHNANEPLKFGSVVIGSLGIRCVGHRTTSSWVSSGRITTVVYSPDKRLWVFDASIMRVDSPSVPLFAIVFGLYLFSRKQLPMPSLVRMSQCTDLLLYGGPWVSSELYTWSSRPTETYRSRGCKQGRRKFIWHPSRTFSLRPPPQLKVKLSRYTPWRRQGGEEV
jgi:hypothetical protein